MNENSIAFGAPGIEPRWTSSAKEGIGTAYHSSSTIWFTLIHGIVNEIYFPHVDTPNTRDLQFLITDGETFCHEEKRDLNHLVEYPERRTQRLSYRAAKPRKRHFDSRSHRRRIIDIRIQQGTQREVVAWHLVDVFQARSQVDSSLTHIGHIEQDITRQLVLHIENPGIDAGRFPRNAATADRPASGTNQTRRARRPHDRRG